MGARVIGDVLEFDTVGELKEYLGIDSGAERPTERRKSSRKSTNDYTKLSRKLSLYERAASTGQWSTGAYVDPILSEAYLEQIASSLSDQEISHLTPNGARIVQKYRQQK